MPANRWVSHSSPRRFGSSATTIRSYRPAFTGGLIGIESSFCTARIALRRDLTTSCASCTDHNRTVAVLLAAALSRASNSLPIYRAS